MTARSRRLAPAALLLAALLAGPVPGAPPPAQQAARQELRLREATAMREAYLLLAAANGVYAGHRGKAMGEVRAAVKILDEAVLKYGTPAQKAETVLQDTAAARARVVAKHVKGVKEPQALSDAQLRAAAGLLVGTRAVLAQNGQKKVLGHVNKAVAEIDLALRARR